MAKAKPIEEMSVDEIADAIDSANYFGMNQKTMEGLIRSTSRLRVIHEETRAVPIENSWPGESDADEHGNVEWYSVSDVCQWITASYDVDEETAMKFQFSHWRRIHHPKPFEL